MKILRVVSDLYPFVVGGLEIHAHEMSKEQARLGHNITVYTSNIDGKPTQEYKDGYRIQRFKTILKLIGNSFMPMLLIKLIHTRNDFDVIHAHSHLFFSTNVCALIRRLGSPPLIITNHGIMSASAPDWFNMLYIKTIGKWTLKSADMIICYTQIEKDKLVDILKIDSEKICVIPNGVNTDLFHPDPDTDKLSNPSNAITILWVGRFVRGKGIEYLIHAAKIIVKEVPDLKILLIGDGPSKGKIEGLIEKCNLKNTVVIKENIANEHMPAMYQKSAIFVLPSLNEGVPKTLLEAMACGKPVIISKFPHLAELIKNAGLVFPKGNVQSLVANMKTLIENKELAQKLGEKGRNKIIGNYSWENTVLKTTELYEDIVGHKR